MQEYAQELNRMKQYVVLLLALAGCAFEPVLVPDKTARRVGDKVAFTETHGVRVSVNGDAWHGSPSDLPEVLTPLHVRIENDGQVPLRLAHRDFAIVSESGARYRALAPLQAGPSLHPVALRGALPRVAPRFGHRSFYVAPDYSSYYPGFPLWGAPFPYSRSAAAWPQALPTDDMIAEALPEGVLEPGGHVDGFVYFQSVSNREGRVRFDLKLIDAESDEQLGEAIVPMAVKLR